MKPKLLFAISSHGFGHFSMTVPIINQLIAEDRFEIVLRTTVPEKLIQSRIPHALPVVKDASDFGMLMNSSLDIDLEKSYAAYEKLHGNWERAIEDEMQKLRGIAPDLIVSNIPYVTLVAARQLGIPALAYCSLNWAHIALSCFQANDTFAKTIYPQMLEAYNMAEHFIIPVPSMDMPGLNNLIQVGPVCTTGVNRKNDILDGLGLQKATKLVLVSPGGVATPIAVDEWPQLENVVWICAWDMSSDRSDIVCFRNIPLSFPDLSASVDCIVTKPGYGTVSESTCLGKPVVYVKRGNWAEEPGLIKWWQENANVCEVTRNQFFHGDFVKELMQLFHAEPRNPIAPTGNQQVVQILNQYLHS